MRNISSCDFLPSYPWVCLLIILVKMQYYLTPMMIFFSLMTYYQPSFYNVTYIASDELQVDFVSYRNILTLNIGNMVEHLRVIWLEAKNDSTPKALSDGKMLLGMLFILPHVFQWRFFLWMLILFLFVGFLQCNLR